MSDYALHWTNDERERVSATRAALRGTHVVLLDQSENVLRIAALSELLSLVKEAPTFNE